MATYEIQAPGGAVYHIEGPDNADPSAVIAQLMGKHAPAAPEPAPNPATDFGGDTLQFGPWDTHIPIGQGVQNFLAGAGKATTDIGRGIGQLGAGIADVVAPRDQTLSGLVAGKPQSRVDEWRQAVADSRKRDAPLMQTGAGKAGFITGNVVDSLPAAFVPGAGTLAGSAAIGAGLGLIQPSASTGETLQNVGMGAATGPASLLLGRGAGALYQGGKAAIEPLFRGGQERIAARTMQAFAGSPQAATDAANAIRNAPAVLPGVQPTTAEVANNAGIAQFERTLRNNPENLTALTARNQQNRAAMTGALDQIAGTPAQMNAATAARTATAAPLYQVAQAAQAPTDAVLTNLLQRPSMQAAFTRAERLAAENGETITGINGQTLQYLKMALNDMVDTGPQSGIGAHEVRALRSTLSDLNGWIRTNIPALRTADQAYASASGPINQMQVGGALRDRLVPALGDFGNNTRLSAQNFANAVRNGDTLAAHETGLPTATLQGVLSPQQMTTVRQVGEQLARRANADELGRATGSNTGQNLASQNVLRQFLGPLGLPQTLGERAAQSTLGQTLLRPLQWAGSLGEPRVMERLARAALDPQEAHRLLTMARTNPRLAREIWARQSLLGPVGQTAQQGLLGPNPSQQ